VQVEDFVPTDGFFPKYLAWVRRLTDAPECYHVVSALGVMSACTSNWTEGQFEVITSDNETLKSVFASNLWVLIVGPSGDRKSTAMNYAVSVGADSIPHSAAISGSPEATFDLVSQRPDVFFYHPEGSTLFAQLQASYWMQGQGFLCDLYDGRSNPPYKRVLTGQRDKKNPSPQTVEIVIRRPRVSILVGIAPDLLDQTRKSDWTGGLIGRMLLVYGERAHYDQTPPREDEVGRLDLQKQIAEIRKSLEEYVHHGKILRVGMRQDALEAYMSWAQDLDNATSNRPPKLRALFRRLPLHILRVALLYAVSQFHDAILLSSMLPAIRLGEYSKTSIDRVGDLLADDPDMRNAVRIRDMLRSTSNGLLSVAQISDELRLSWKVIDPAVKTLTATGRVKLRMEENNPDAKFLQLITKEEWE
jgi:hypothetical protein